MHAPRKILQHSTPVKPPIELRSKFASRTLLEGCKPRCLPIRPEWCCLQMRPDGVSNRPGVPSSVSPRSGSPP
eukprot:6481301-Alexandrium_andersonii.AAC.1